MPTLSTPQSQAGVMSFYDAPSKGPQMNARLVLVGIAIFSVAILILDYVSAHP
ncbi:MAG: preprotein translocase subunit Sec61beta [Candidatus Micrarchaeota archaeon]|nr:preprotein translocase subunit Sec61beta [Candidatus Micrarchaeota archaeon]MDE1848216.1 preprotein translocase subunit Sec61beta [Candidatus Micrarchaeota archaeon]MDE1864864.1 preprotein translocase subunit Sec61beta [Candidatus Micrarchaeota archaeon]